MDEITFLRLGVDVLILVWVGLMVWTLHRNKSK